MGCCDCSIAAKTLSTKDKVIKAKNIKKSNFSNDKIYVFLLYQFTL